MTATAMAILASADAPQSKPISPAREGPAEDLGGDGGGASVAPPPAQHPAVVAARPTTESAQANPRQIQPPPQPPLIEKETSAEVAGDQAGRSGARRGARPGDAREVGKWGRVRDAAASRQSHCGWGQAQETCARRCIHSHKPREGTAVGAACGAAPIQAVRVALWVLGVQTESRPSGVAQSEHKRKQRLCSEDIVRTACWLMIEMCRSLWSLHRTKYSISTINAII